MAIQLNASRYLLLSAVLILPWVLYGCAQSSPKPELTHTERARLYLDFANAELADGDPTGALESLLKAEDEDSDLPEIYHSKGLVFHAKHDDVTAIFEVKKALAMNPNYAEANNTLGTLLLDQGKFDEAIAPLSVAAKNPLYRDAYKAYTSLGIGYYRGGQILKAEQSLNRAILNAPTMACIAYFYRGHVRMRDHRLPAAIRDYDQATRKSCAGFADAHLALGIAYQQNRQFDLARKKFLEVEQRFPDTNLAEQAVRHMRYLP